VEIDHESPLSISRLPPDLASPANPFVSLSQIIANAFGVFSNVAEILTSLPMLGYAAPQDQPSRWELLSKTLPYLNPYSSTLAANNITLKQFRDAESPTLACYQALVNSQMTLNTYNGGGFLGDLNLLRGDLTGGFRIKIHRYASQPIIESLGLEVAEQHTIEDHTISVLKPAFPYWLAVDLNYGCGETICWRAKGSPTWRSSSTTTLSTPLLDKEESESAPPPRIHFTEASSAEDALSYNTARGAAIQEIAGPFRFPNVTVRVLPLLADSQCLQRFCSTYLENDFYRFEPWGSSVYLLVMNYGEMSSATNNIGWWAEREAAFSLPLKWYEKSKGEDRLISLALVSPFVFANSSMAAITGREVEGRPVMQAALDSPDDTWMNESGPGAERHLLRLTTEILPALYLGQKAEERAVLEIHQAEVRPLQAGEWGQTLLQDHREKVARKHRHPEDFVNLKALALELLAHEEPFNEVTLKQFRDAAAPERACYQSIVLWQRVIEDVYEIQEMDDLMHVRILQYPTQPIVNLLGLQVKARNVLGPTVVEELQPIRPFWMRLAMRQELGKNLCWRLNSEQWRKGQPPGNYFVDTQPTRVAPRFVEALDTPGRLAQLLPGTALPSLKSAIQGLRQAPASKRAKQDLISRQDAGNAIERLNPQMVIDSILSKEWQRPSQDRSRQRREQKRDFYIRSDSLGPLGASLFQEGRMTHRGAWYSEEEQTP
jgi:hypothetical protein